MIAPASIAAPQADVNLSDLRNQSLVIVARAIGLIAYLWFVFVVWPITGARADLTWWLASGILVVGVSLSYLLRRLDATIAAVVLIISTLASISGLIVGMRSPYMAYLFSVPVMVASVLLGPWVTGLVGGVAIILSATLGTTTLHLAPISQEVLLPILTTALTTLCSWLSGRSLYTALDWTWNGYERAREQEEASRQRGSELRQALKSLDEATYRLERTNHMLALARAQAEDARRMKQQFAQTISHELRTPLNLIVGFTELMAQSPEYYGVQLPANYVRDLSVVHRNARHLQQLVTDVLDLARIEAAQMSLVFEDCDLAQLVTEAVNTVRSLVESRGLTLQTTVEPELPHLWVDPMRIRQVLINLLNNAARYTDGGGVSVRAFRQDGGVTFEVRDTGVGIAPEDLTKVFSEFQQFADRDGRRRGGAGLGLAICRQFVALHGGRIWVESQLGQGSTFSFSLPERHSTLLMTGSDDLDERPAAMRHEREHILMAVTRSLSAAVLLTHYVQRIRTVVVQDLAQAASSAHELMPQAVVIDTMSVAMEDSQLAPLADAPCLAETPIVLCPLPGEESLRQELAVDGYLIKPVSREALWDVLRPFGDAVDRVLVIDDDREFVRLLTRLLDDPVRRYEVAAAYNGQEALEVLRRWPPDLVLLDLGLPDIDGAVVLERLRAENGHENLPVVIISGRGDSGDLQVLPGDVTIRKHKGLSPGEVVRYLQSVVDAAITRVPATR